MDDVLCRPRGRHVLIDEEYRVATILIVDDESDILFLLRMTLEAAGYSVVEAENGADAVQQMNSDPPDLIITDLMMPVMDGRELIRRIREAPDLRNVPVILVSANPSTDVGAEVIIRKPFRQEELINNVRTLLGEAS